MNLLKKLKINGREVQTVSNQIVFDIDPTEYGEEIKFDDEPTTDPMFPVADEPLPEWKSEKRTRPKCICGSRSIGIGDYMTGHDKDCDVHEDKTPVIW